MKRFVIPLLASIALPTAINAQSTYLTCELNEKRSNNNAGEQTLRGGQIVTVPNPNSKFSDWETMNFIVEFTLNEEDQKGSVYFPNNGVTKKLALVNFQAESIIISNSVDSNTKDVFDISRLDGSIFREIEFFGGTMILEYKGSCKKAEPKKTLF